jgi:hypothetical protein
MQPSSVIKLSPEEFFAWLPGQEANSRSSLPEFGNAGRRPRGGGWEQGFYRDL